MKTKHFKILSLLLIVSLTFSSCSKEENDFESIKSTSVAELRNGKAIITLNEKDLLSRFEQLAKTDNIDVKYNHLEIKRMEDGSYAMFAFSDDYLIKSATALNLSDNRLIVSNSYGGSITCKTTGCSSSTGCTPYQKQVITHEGSGKVWTCTECSSDCTKSMTVNL